MRPAPARRPPPPPEVLLELLRTVYKLDAFRSPQLEVIREILAGFDCVLLM